MVSFLRSINHSVFIQFTEIEVVILAEILLGHSSRTFSTIYEFSTILANEDISFDIYHCTKTPASVGGLEDFRVHILEISEPLVLAFIQSRARCRMAFYVGYPVHAIRIRSAWVWVGGFTRTYGWFIDSCRPDFHRMNRPVLWQVSVARRSGRVVLFSLDLKNLFLVSQTLRFVSSSYFLHRVLISLIFVANR